MLEFYRLIDNMINDEFKKLNVPDPQNMKRYLKSSEICNRIHDGLDEANEKQEAIKRALDILSNAYMGCVDAVLQRRIGVEHFGKLKGKVIPAPPEEPSGEAHDLIMKTK